MQPLNTIKHTYTHTHVFFILNNIIVYYNFFCICNKKTPLRVWKIIILEEKQQQMCGNLIHFFVVVFLVNIQMYFMIKMICVNFVAWLRLIVMVCNWSYQRLLLKLIILLKKEGCCCWCLMMMMMPNHLSNTFFFSVAFI